MNDEHLLTAQELAERLKVNVVTVQRRTRCAPFLPHVKLGTAKRYRWADVVAHLATYPIDGGAVDAN